MTSKIDGEVARVDQHIGARTRYIDNQAALIDVLEHDRQDVLEQRKARALGSSRANRTTASAVRANCEGWSAGARMRR